MVAVRLSERATGPAALLSGDCCACVPLWRRRTRHALCSTKGVLTQDMLQMARASAEPARRKTIMKSNPRFEVNVCGGDFHHVCECFREWKKELLIYRRDQMMFEGRDEVRPLAKQNYDNTEQARKALQNACSPRDIYALAAEVSNGERDMWIVMAAYCE
jgi:hypothetical protein